MVSYLGTGRRERWAMNTAADHRGPAAVSFLI